MKRRDGVQSFDDSDQAQARFSSASVNVKTAAHISSCLGGMTSGEIKQIKCGASPLPVTLSVPVNQREE